MKNTKKLPKRLVTLLLALATIVSSMGLTTILAFAWAHPDVNAMEVELYTDQDKTYSSSKMGPNMYYEGKNMSTQRTVIFRPQYYEPVNSEWIKTNSHDIAPGNELLCQLTETRSYQTYWRLALYSKGAFKNARAVGWIW